MSKNPNQKLKLLYQDIQTFAAGAEQADDITMLLLQINETPKGERNG